MRNIVIGGLLLASFSLYAACQQDEQAVRAAFVFNLTKYISFPHAHDEVVIGFIGHSSTGATLKHVMDGKQSDGRRVQVVLNPTDAEMLRCAVLYFGDAPSDRIRPNLDRIRGNGILTVGETESFTREGGIVGLVRAGDQIQIEINLEEARNAGLKINARLLDLSVIVHTTRGG